MSVPDRLDPTARGRWRDAEREGWVLLGVGRRWAELEESWRAECVVRRVAFVAAHPKRRYADLEFDLREIRCDMPPASLEELTGLGGTWGAQKVLFGQDWGELLRLPVGRTAEAARGLAQFVALHARPTEDP